MARRVWAEARIRRLGPMRKAMKRWLVDWDLCVGFMLMAALLVTLGMLGLLASA